VTYNYERALNTNKKKVTDSADIRIIYLSFPFTIYTS